MMKTIKIDGTEIGFDQPPYVIAELSGNHNGSIERAIDIIDFVKTSGARAVKLQTYRPDTITLKSDLPDFQIKDGLWAGRSLWDLYEWAHTPWEWHKPLFEHAKKREITMFSSPFDTTAVDLLEDLNAPAYKIASFEAVDLQLIRYAASTGKPMIISTGMADQDEVGEAVAAARDGGCNDFVLLLCVSGYPAPAQDYNLQTLKDMAVRFDCLVGLSDHTLSNTTAIASVALGATVIEKHVTLSRDGGGPDDSFSLEPLELKDLCKSSRTAWDALGHVDYGRKSSEIGNVKFRRSLYFVADLQPGDVIEPHHVRSVRPGYGIAPKHIDALIGTKVTRQVNANTPVQMTDIGSK
ncbi:MAG: pseudaminic acid synthase [Pseudomonadota bacterium]